MVSSWAIGTVARVQGKLLVHMREGELGATVIEKNDQEMVFVSTAVGKPERAKKAQTRIVFSAEYSGRWVDR